MSSHSEDMELSLSKDSLSRISSKYQSSYREKRIMLSFSDYLEHVFQNPSQHVRNSAMYIKDAFGYFGTRHLEYSDLVKVGRYRLFDMPLERSTPIVGGELVHQEIHNILEKMTRHGFVNKLILLHGPNGSAKTSTVESISQAMQNYSHAQDGAIYKFNWVFPADHEKTALSPGESHTIGFSSLGESQSPNESFALLDEKRISAKLTSEFRENPLFLLPMPYRETFLREAMAKEQGVRPDEVEIPKYILQKGLAKRNQEILDCLIHAYEGSFLKAIRHIQVERFFFSRQYRVGISTIEPQMSIDAMEKQITLDKNYSQLPSILQTISFHQLSGELIEANRGLLEFSDLLKRPLEAFKYLLSTIEKGSLSLPSGIANLDAVFIATSNEKHLDAFKTSPDFSSFRGRFELITVPYLLFPNKEMEIYKEDVRKISSFKAVTPHSLEILCKWAVLTRLKQPDPEYYPREVRNLVTRIDPFLKIKVYQKERLQPFFTKEEENKVFGVRDKLWSESQNMVVYEGRFGASPREVRMLLYRAAQDPDDKELLPMMIIKELRYLVKNRTLYEFLQFEPRGKYHDASLFIDQLEEEFCASFHSELVGAMDIAEEQEYRALLVRYVENVVAQIKNEKLYNEASKDYIDPSEKVMHEVETILQIKLSKQKHRENLLGRIAGFKLDNPQMEIDLSLVFEDYLRAIINHFYEKKEQEIEENAKILIQFVKSKSTLSDDEVKFAESTYQRLEKIYGYSQYAAYKCLQFSLFRNK